MFPFIGGTQDSWELAFFLVDLWVKKPTYLLLQPAI